MKLTKTALATVAAIASSLGLTAFQLTADFGFGNEDSPSNVKAEFYWSRLAYASNMASFNGFGRGYGGYNAWSRDYPKADRQFLIAMHRLTRIDGRPYEQVVTLDSDEVFNYPWIYAVQVQRWSFTDAEAKRLRAKLHKLKDELRRRMHLPVPEQGLWLGRVVRGHLNYYAVPGNIDAVAAFRTQATRHWFKALRRRSQKTSLTWERMDRLANRWLPPARVLHPYPEQRFDVRTLGRSPVR